MTSGPIEQILNCKEGVVYTLALKGVPGGLGKRLEELPWVTNAKVASNNGTSVWQISVSDEAAAEKDLLRHVLADPALMVAQFNRKKYELEEVFMEIVKGDGNDR